jgi:hypothetical protein
MPAQKRLLRHDQTASALPRQDSRQCCKQRAISWPQLGAPLLPLEYDQLMSQDEQFDVFGELAAAAAGKQTQHSREGGIGEREEHAADAPIARYEVQQEENAARSSATELRSPQRSGTRARASTQKPAQTVAAARRTGILKPLRISGRKEGRNQTLRKPGFPSRTS